MAEKPKDEGHTLRARAYSAATRDLRDAHAEEFRGLLAKHYEALGLEVRPRLTDEERAVRDAARAAEKVAKAEARKQAKIDRLRAEIEALDGGDSGPVDEPSF
jgi:hypothetical protein